MNILVQAADLDHSRIDGTRVYLREVLKRLGTLCLADTFTLAHRGDFHPAIAPPLLHNYAFKRWPFPVAWMQTRFVWELWWEKPDVLWLPVQAMPWLVPRRTSVVVTVHDLAWKYFPETFTWFQRWRLDAFLGLVVRRADRLVAVSEATKRDLLKFYPRLEEQKIKVIHHGFDRDFFGSRISREKLDRQLSRYQLQVANYILFVGALQPRKNLGRLIRAFETAKKKNPEMKLVLAGERAWLSAPILQAIQESPFRGDILLTGPVSFEDLRALYQGAMVFVFPSLYEGFGLPLLEAFASETPVLTGKNSSLSEVAGDAALLCDVLDEADMAEKLGLLWHDASLRVTLIEKGKARLERFSWEHCARETLDVLHEARKRS